MGLPFFAEEFPPKNAPIVDRMLNAGAIPIGRTNLPEMGLRLDTDNPLRGRTFNPWNKEINSWRIEWRRSSGNCNWNVPYWTGK